MPARPAGASLLLSIALAGCATFSDDGGFDLVAAASDAKLGSEARWLKDEESRASARAQIGALLEGGLTADEAVQVALLANPRLQAEYANLGIAEADRVQAGRLPNPGFSFSRTAGGGAREIESALHFNVLAFLTLPLRAGIESRRFEAAKLAAAATTIEVGLGARAAYFEAVAARQTVQYFLQVGESAAASRELMVRMRRVGNASRLELAREQLFNAQTAVALARARREEVAARERLIRALGVWGEHTGLELPDRLPDLPSAPRRIEDVERQAIEQRLDVRRDRRALDSLASNLRLSRATRFVNVLEIGPAQVRERGEPTRDGYEIALEIPLFDWGGARVTKAQALYDQAADRLRATAIDARSEVREAYLSYRGAYDLAKHFRDEIVPLSKRISDEQLLRYNGMLIGVFELIAGAREQIASVRGYLDALREFWLADTGLQMAMHVGAAPRRGIALPPMRGNGPAH